jgi:hypothetical protein
MYNSNIHAGTVSASVTCIYCIVVGVEFLCSLPLREEPE